MSHNLDDPRDANLEVKLSIPKAWASPSYDVMPAIGMGVSGTVMMTRNRYLAWPAVLLGLNNYLNQKPISTKDDTGSFQAIISGVAALMLTYFPMLIIPKQPTPVQTPLPIPA